MNTPASHFLRTLSTVGVRSVHFRLLSQHDVAKHTTPVAILEDGDTLGHRMPRFSIAELFSAYSLTPRKGYYTLDVDHGQLSFTPPGVRVTPAAETTSHSTSPSKRWKPKVTAHRLRKKASRSRKFPSA